MTRSFLALPGGGTDGAAVAVGSSGANGVIATTGTMVWDDDQTWLADVGETHGILITGAASGADYIYRTITTTNTLGVIMAISDPTPAAAGAVYLFAGVGSTRSFQIGPAGTTGKLAVYDSTNAVVYTFTNAVPATTPVYLKVFATAGAGTGTIRVAMVNIATGATIEDTGTLSAQQMGASGFTQVRYGKATTGNRATPFTVAYLGLDDAATGLLPNYAPPSAAPTGSATISHSKALIVATGAPGSGGSLVYTLTPMTNATVLADGVWVVERSTPDQAVVYRWRITEDSTGQFVEGNVTVLPLTPVSDGTAEELVFDGGWGA